MNKAFPLEMNGAYATIGPMFLDEAVISVRSGKGGDGAASFRQEKHVPKGGPDGGDGGNGGDVLFVADHKLTTLLDYKYKRKFSAEEGGPGLGDKKHGKTAKTIRLRVPIGTVIKDAETNETFADLTFEGARFLACKGGRGGRGNLHFTSSVRQAPTFAEKGEPGEQRKLRLELKLMADVGLVGLPNAGKSTLISAISAAKPKIADYPFTTLIPNLGIVKAGDESFVVADLPGLIQGASEGKGLGQRFLKHAERTRVIVHVVECAPLDESEPLENFKIIQRELRSFSRELSEKPALIALSKIDLLSEYEGVRSKLSETGLEVFPISAVTGRGLEPLVFRIAGILAANPPEIPVAIIEPKPITEGKPQFAIVKDNEEYIVQGDAVVKMVARTNLGNTEALRYLHRKLKGAGVLDLLKEKGAREGDTVRIGQFAFTYLEED